MIIGQLNQLISWNEAENLYDGGIPIRCEEFLILDEPFNGFDPEITAVLKRLLTKYRDRGNMILFSIHNLNLVSNFFDRIIFLIKNRKISMADNTKSFKGLEKLFLKVCRLK